MDARVVVIGGGAIGASCFYHLVQKTAGDVLLIEQAGLGSGSTGRSAAVIETQYLHPDKVAFCAYTMRLCRRLEAEHGLTFVHHGYMRLGHSGEDLDRFRQSLEIQRAHGLTDAVVLDPTGIRKHAPGLALEGVTGALFGPSDGYIDAVRYCELLAEAGRAGGGTVWSGGRVTGLRVTGGRVSAVIAGDREIRCEAVVNAAGPWARRVGQLAGVELPIDGYRRQIVIFAPPHPFPRPVPMVVDYVPGVEHEGLYFRDDTAARLVAGLHWEGYADWERPDDPEAFRSDSDWDYGLRVAELLAARWPDATGFRALGGWAGLYPLTPDSQPILGEVPGCAGLYSAIGGGGVGVQTSGALGAIVADLVAKGETSILPSLDAYRLDRFRTAA
jgi:glycine/D-amino acid oxidase-like deaminating enzyme